MNRPACFTCGLWVLVFALVSGCGHSNRSAAPASGNTAALPPEIRAFAARKENQAKALAAQFKLQADSELWAFFAAAKRGTEPEVARLWEKLKARRQAAQYESSKADLLVTSPVWQAVLETELACEPFASGEP